MKITSEESGKIISAMVEDNIIEVANDGYVVRIQKMIDAQVANSIIDGVVSTCFDEDGSYNPKAKEFAKRLALIVAYTDIELPESAAAQYAFVYGTKYFDYVVEHANNDQLSDIFNTIENMIEYRVRSNTDALLGNVMKLYAELNSVVSGMDGIYKDLSADRIAAFVQAVTDSKLDEEKLVKAIVAEGK